MTTEIVKQLNNRVLEVCRALFGRDPDLHSPDPTLIQYGDILIRNSGPRIGSWITGINPETNQRRESNSLLELIRFRFRFEVCEAEALDWARNRGPLNEPPPAPTPPKQKPAGDGDGAKPGNKEKTRYIEQVAEPGKSIVGTKANPFWKWKSPWYEQVAIQVV